MGVLNLEFRKGSWFAIIVVPERLRERVGRRVLRRNLGTSDKQTAISVKEPVLLEFRQRLLEAERAIEPTAAAVPEASTPPFNRSLERKLEITMLRERAQRVETTRLERRWRARVTGVEPVRAAPAKVVITFAQASTECVASRRPGWKRDAWSGPLARHAFPVIGDKAVASINVDDVLSVLSPIWVSTPQQAKKLRTYIEGVLAYARVRGWRDGPNVAMWGDNLQHLLAPTHKIAVTQHHESMDWQEIPTFMKRLRDDDDARSRVLEFAILTAARGNEAVGCMWSELDLEGRTWRVPAPRMKQRREHVVPLSDRAVQVVEGMRGKHRSLVFPGRNGKRLGANALQRWVRQLTTGATAHGFRASFRTWCADHGKDSELAEWSLAHVTGGAVEAAYRRSDALERRRVLMQSWSDYCGSSTS
jgi:integrase